MKQAVILAAGMGTRLSNVTKNMIPKGFLELEGKGLIERSIEKLRKNGIEDIIIVTGHLSEVYEAFAEKNSDVHTIKNENYANTGSMASLYTAKDMIKGDFILLESDLIYEERAIKELQTIELKDCILLSGATNSGDEVYVEVLNNSVHRLSKNKSELNSVCGELVGICKISRELLDRMCEEYLKTSKAQFHYEDAVEASGKNYSVGYKKVDDLIWSEIDDESHLQRVRERILPRLIEKGEI